MNGFSLLELMVAMALFSVVIFCGYECLDSEQTLLHQMIIRTKPDAEANYRQLLMKGLISHSSEGFKRDPLAEEAPHFFTDLNFGNETESNSFSIAHPMSDPVRFQKEGSLFRTSPTPVWQKDTTVLLAGSNSSGTYEWNYAKITQVTVINDQQYLAFAPMIEKPEIQSGILQLVEIWGFEFQTDTLYMVGPSGSLQPFFALYDFSYQWNQSALTVNWQPESSIHFMVTP